MAETAYTAPPEDAEEAEANPELLALVGRLKAEAERRVGRRKHIEQRWLEDLRAYHGRYDEQVEEDFNETRRSKLFVNATRQKTNAMAARLEDMLFPTDDRNWGISETPKPELTRAAEAAAEQAMAARAKVPAMPEDAGEAEAMAADPQVQALNAEAERAEDVAARFRAIREEAETRARGMEIEIEDQLVQSRHQAHCRDMIHDGCKIGIGVLKAPVMRSQGMRGRWQVGPDGARMADQRGSQAGVRWVDPWSCFFDPDARTLEEGDGVFERHFMNRKSLRALGREPGFDKDAVRRLVKREGGDEPPDYLNALRAITGEGDSFEGDHRTVWEYSGPLGAKDLEVLVPEDQRAAYGVEGEIDPLSEVNVVLWFSGDEVLKIAPHPLDSGECLYSIFTIEPDESSVYGYGIPRIMRDQQAAMNAAWRMAMDNSGIAAGPQVIMNRSFVEPADGDWELRPFKLWFSKEEVQKTQDVFTQFQPNSNLQELTGLMEVISKQIDDVTGLPMIAQGEQGTDVTKTAQGMSLLMSSSNVMFRRVVKRFDDDVTVPTIRRLYDWNMQQHPDESIKGDFEVEARGAGVLLVREMQAQNLMMMATQFGAHPVFGPMIKAGDLMRSIVRAHTLSPDDIVLTDEEMQEQQAAAAEQPDPAMEIENRKMELQEAEQEVKIQIANLEASTRRYVADQNRETALIQAANRANVDLEKAEAQMEDRERERAARERSLATEVGMKERTGESSGGSV